MTTSNNPGNMYTLIQSRSAGPAKFEPMGLPSPNHGAPISPLNTLQPSPPNVTLLTASSLPLVVETGSPSASSFNGGGMGMPEIKSEPAFSPASSSGVVSPSESMYKQIGSPLTPNAAVQQYAQMQDQQKQRKGPVPRPSEELCLVCGDRASGYHYNALACEGCKGFFRRSITKNSKYSCKYGNGCEMDMYMRRKCQACRLKKCYAVGMRAECVVPESTCQKKRAAKQAQKQATKGGDVISTTNNGANGANRSGSTGLSSSMVQQKQQARLLVQRTLKPEEEELINRIVYDQEEYENPTEEDLRQVYHVPINPNQAGEATPLQSLTNDHSSPSSPHASPGTPNGTNGGTNNESDRLFQHMTEMTILTVQLIVEFSKHLPGFQTLCREDQVSLLKGCSSEVMMLRGARRYDPQCDSIIYATNHPFSNDNYVKAGLGNDELFRFCRNMCKMKVDNAEYALITAIVIFSDRNNIKEPKRVEKIQEIYVEALQSYVMAKRKKDHMVAFAKLLSVLTELRSLGNRNAKTCFELRMSHRKLPPFLAEIWDIK